mgnify:CR=1 FL=1|jgi:hypothetical protein
MPTDIFFDFFSNFFSEFVRPLYFFSILISDKFLWRKPSCIQGG